MASCSVLFDDNSNAIERAEIVFEIDQLEESYKDTTSDIIRDSVVLDSQGSVFTECATHVLKNFKMNKRGISREDLDYRLQDCWSVIGPGLLDLKNYMRGMGVSRERFLMEINQTNREEIINYVWRLTKMVLPFTMTNNSFGLVGASKILFSVLPEVVLPVENSQWKEIFKTVDLGDVLRFMISDIQKWESKTNLRLNTLDRTRRLTTLPAVYNVLAMIARPNSKSN